MKIYKILGFLLVVSIFITACQPQSVETVAPVTELPVATPTEMLEPQEVVNLVVWNTWSEFSANAFQEILDDFNATHEYIQVSQQSQPLADYDAKLIQAISQGTGPDLINTYPEQASNFIDEGFLVNLSDYINDPEIGIEGFRESVSDGVYKEITQWNGDVYMMPMLVGGEVFYYNKTLLDNLNLEVPTTWKELEESGRIILAETGKPAFGFDSISDGFQVLISQNGSGYINTDTMTVEYNNPIALEQLTWYCGLVKEGVFRLVGEDMYFSNPFGSQAVASYAGSAAGYSFVKSAVNEQFEFGVAPIPQGGTQEYISAWGQRWIIFKSTDAKQRAAYEFLKYMISPEVLAKWAVGFGGVPAFQAAIDHPVFQEYLANNPAAMAQRLQIQRTGFIPAPKGSAAVKNAIGKAVISACTDLVTPEEALKIAEEEGNTELAAYK